jgi:N-acetylneuraminic acid mutarotase
MWTQLASASGPSARSAQATVYDSNGNMVIFGGYDGTSSLNDVWSYNIQNQKWTQLSSVSGPTGRLYSSAIYTGNGNMIVFGGFNNSSWAEFNGVWNYNISSQSWTLLNPTNGINP